MKLRFQEVIQPARIGFSPCFHAKIRIKILKRYYLCSRSSFPIAAILFLLSPDRCYDVKIIYRWSVKEKQTASSENYCIPTKLLGELYRKLRFYCTKHLVDRPLPKIGGPHHLCKCDESMFTYKQKYGRGRVPQVKNSVFGIMTTEYRPCRGIFQVVPRRPRATLTPITQNAIAPGSTVQTDNYPAYRNLERH
ncbi:uncharacterized protein LOC125573740 [Nematostella vectensis]|uniref:uncharacterized protein LOC125573740 n=1 Tax=Nematostella vectensis TaxID=45351 RepID=UPI0020779C0A|nr:uncharacterized protein LOC125573740 [Nematostella vectensis]